MLKMVQPTAASAPSEIARSIAYGAAHQVAELELQSLFAERDRLDTELRSLAAQDRSDREVAANIQSLHKERDEVQARITATKPAVLDYRRKRAAKLEAALTTVQAEAAQELLDHLLAARIAFGRLRDCRSQVERAGGPACAIPAVWPSAHIERAARKFI